MSLARFSKWFDERKMMAERFQKKAVKSFCYQCPLYEPDICCKFMGEKYCEVLLGKDDNQVLQEKCPYWLEKEINEWNKEK